MDILEQIGGRGISGQPYEVSSQVEDARYFHLPRIKGSAPKLRVAYGGRERCSPPYRIDRETFPFHGLEFVADGRGWLTLSGDRSELAPGSAFAYGPGVPCKIENDPSRPMVKYFIEFEGTDARRFIGSLPMSRTGTIRVNPIADMTFLFESLIEEGRRQLPLRGEICETYLRLVGAKLRQLALAQQPARDRAWLGFERARRIAEEHFLKIGTLDDFARMAKIEPSYLCRLFRRYLDTSPARFVIERKMQRALEMLRTHDLPIRQIADRIGFADPYHFSRVFKKIHGLPPARFRRE